MGVTLLIVLSLAVVLGITLLLWGELYCFLLLHRRQMRNSNPQTTTTTATTTTIANVFSSSHSPTPHPPHQQQHSPPPSPPFTSIYSQGVMQAPRSILFPPFSSTLDMAEPKKLQHQEQQHLSELHQIIQIQTQGSNANANAKSRCIGLVSVPSSLEPSKPFQQDSLQGTTTSTETIDKSCSGGEHLVYISNPVYENEEGKESEPNTPFETPDTSPSRLERSGSSGDDDDDDEVEVSHCDVQTLPSTPPLTPMKKLPGPEEACSVSVRDTRSLATSGSDSHSKNALSSSFSASPCTSPSW